MSLPSELQLKLRSYLVVEQLRKSAVLWTSRVMASTYHRMLPLG